MARLDAARPKSVEPGELGRAILASAELYAQAREELKARHDPELRDDLMRKVLSRLREAPSTHG